MNLRRCGGRPHYFLVEIRERLVDISKPLDVPRADLFNIVG
jgi:hypothetical protein